MSGGFFLVVFFFTAVWAWRKVKGKHEYTLVRAKESEEDKEGLPVYEEIESVDIKAGEST